jgi:hypothetical protein
MVQLNERLSPAFTGLVNNPPTASQMPLAGPLSEHSAQMNMPPQQMLNYGDPMAVSLAMAGNIVAQVPAGLQHQGTLFPNVIMQTTTTPPFTEPGSGHVPVVSGVSGDVPFYSYAYHE